VPGRSDRAVNDSAEYVRIASLRRDGDKDRIVLRVTIDLGFHINANPASFDYLIPTTLNVSNETPLRVLYPPRVLFKPKFSDQPLKVYEGTVQIGAQFRENSLTASPYLFGTLTVQACTVAICLPPADLPLPHRPAPYP
jgi:hypothetical protein